MNTQEPLLCEGLVGIISSLLLYGQASLPHKEELVPVLTGLQAGRGLRQLGREEKCQSHAQYEEPGGRGESEDGCPSRMQRLRTGGMEELGVLHIAHLWKCQKPGSPRILISGLLLTLSPACPEESLHSCAQLFKTGGI